MPLEAVAIVLAAAFLHALWNLLLARSPDPSAGIAVATAVGALVTLPLAIARWRLEPEALPWVAVSATLELVYFVLLARAYRRADLSLVYPVARGLSPVLVLVGSVLWLQEPASPIAFVGIAMVAVGVVLVRGLRAPASVADVVLAAVIGLCIAGYTLADQQGVRHADPITYLLLVVGIPAVAWCGWLAVADGPARLRAALRPPIVAGGVAALGAYGLILVALGMAWAPGVAALRETSIVMATVMAALVLHERVERSRWLGSLVLVAGIALVVAG
ncbi:MAG: DMT family transporter [Candidatus Limnocylindrales bacterium]